MYNPANWARHVEILYTSTTPTALDRSYFKVLYKYTNIHQILSSFALVKFVNQAQWFSTLISWQVPKLALPENNDGGKIYCGILWGEEGSWSIVFFVLFSYIYREENRTFSIFQFLGQNTEDHLLLHHYFPSRKYATTHPLHACRCRERRRGLSSSTL